MHLDPELIEELSLRLVVEAMAPGTLTVSAAGNFQDPDGGAIPASFAAARIVVEGLVE